MAPMMPSDSTTATHANVLVLPAGCENNDAPAIVCPSVNGSAPAITLSYAQLVALVASLQVDFADAGITRASRVALVLPNGPEFVAALLAIIRQRGIVAPLNSRYTRDEFQGLFARMEPELVVMLAPRRADEDELLMHPGFQAAQALGICVALLDRETTGASVEAGGRVCNGVHNGATNGAATNGASTNGATNGVHKVEKNGVTNGHGMKAGVASNGVSHGKANADGRLRLTLRLVEFRDGSLSPALTSAKAAVVPREEIWSEDKALMLFTSGTTGLPRPVPLSHTNLLVAMRNVIANHELSPADRAFIITPLCYIVGACGSLLATLFSGGCAVIPESLPDNFWQRCAEHEITWFYALPHTYRVLLGLPRPNGRVPSQLRFIRCGGGETPPDLYESLVALGPPLVESYGMTETGPAILCNYLTEGDGAGKKRRAHYPVPDAVDVMILPCDGPCSGPATADWDPAARLSNEPGVVGEVCLRGKNITSGYLNDPKANFEAFLSNGFFRTGDLGTILPDGYLRLMGRIKEIICKNDGKVSPAEVEHVAQSHGSVAGAACFRIADMYGGDEIGLAVALRPHAEAGPPADADLRRHIRERLADFKTPKEIVFVDSIPCNQTGKPMRTRLSQEFAEGLLV